MKLLRLKVLLLLPALEAAGSLNSRREHLAPFSHKSATTFSFFKGSKHCRGLAINQWFSSALSPAILGVIVAWKTKSVTKAQYSVWTVTNLSAHLKIKADNHWILGTDIWKASFPAKMTQSVSGWVYFKILIYFDFKILWKSSSQFQT